MVTLTISGIPKRVKLTKFLNFLKGTVFKMHKEFQIKYVRPVDETTKKIAFIMNSNDARKATNFLNNYNFSYADCCYNLECFIETVDEGQTFHQNKRSDLVEDYEPPQKSRKYSRSPVRSRSHSPNYSKELREIELKIELVRKQRILMEEETKLLLEKRKLEYLKNIGSNTKLLKFEEICRRNDANEISNFIVTAQSSNSSKPGPGRSKLPCFLGPCNEITQQMHRSIKSHSDINDEIRTTFWNLLRSTLKKRLAVVLEGKGYLTTKSIVAVYRQKHPEATDKDLIEELLHTISTSCWPKKNKKNRNSDKNEGHKYKAENPDAAADEIKINDSGDISSIETSQLVDFNEFVDMENDYENWEEDDEEQGGQDITININVENQDEEQEGQDITKEINVENENKEQEGQDIIKEINDDDDDDEVSQAIESEHNMEVTNDHNEVPHCVVEFENTNDLKNENEPNQPNDELISDSNVGDSAKVDTEEVIVLKENQRQ